MLLLRINDIFVATYTDTCKSDHHIITEGNLCKYGEYKHYPIDYRYFCHRKLNNKTLLTSSYEGKHTKNYTTSSFHPFKLPSFSPTCIALPPLTNKNNIITNTNNFMSCNLNNNNKTIGLYGNNDINQINSNKNIKNKKNIINNSNNKQRDILSENNSENNNNYITNKHILINEDTDNHSASLSPPYGSFEEDKRNQKNVKKRSAGYFKYDEAFSVCRWIEDKKSPNVRDIEKSMEKCDLPCIRKQINIY